ncbi:MAG: alanine racemase [Bacilli bacterium]|nr:alanine racemase [Bacilli bacterium]
MYRPTYIKVDGNKLENNIKNIISNYSDYKYYFAVVKNNAYHHGIYAAKYMINGGANYLAVSSLEEAISLRKYFIDIPVLILEPIMSEYIYDAINNNITITIGSLTEAEDLCDLKLTDQVKVHLKIDSGMSRLGFRSQSDFDKAYKLLSDNKKVLIEGIYTHLATSGVNDLHYRDQINNFLKITRNVDLKSIPIIHVDRSLTLVTHDKLDFANGFRMGIAMYGYKPRINTGNFITKLKRNHLWKTNSIKGVHLTNNLDLEFPLSMYSKVIQVRRVLPGDFVGYGALYKVKDESYIATIPAGYADGVIKDFKCVYINNNPCEIVAECMDMIMVKVNNSVNVGDEVEIIGKHQSVKDVGLKAKLSGYKFLNLFSTRVPIVYTYDDEEIEIKY